MKHNSFDEEVDPVAFMRVTLFLLILVTLLIALLVSLFKKSDSKFEDRGFDRLVCLFHPECKSVEIWNKNIQMTQDKKITK